MDFSTFGKWMVFCGLGIALLGAILWGAGKWGIPLGNLPGDIRIERPGFSFRFPVVTCLLVSLAVTALWHLVGWFLRR